jgi:hypothetical protein
VKLTEHVIRLSGLIGGRVDVAGDGLWGTVVFSRRQPGDPSLDGYGLRKWSMSGTSPLPRSEIRDHSGWSSIGVRASADQQHVGWLAHLHPGSTGLPASVTRIELMDASALGISPQGLFTMEEGLVVPSSSAFAVTSEAALSVAFDRRVRLHPLQSMSGTVPPLVPAGTLPFVELTEAQQAGSQVLAMGRGHAWVGWRPGNAPSIGLHNRLSQLRYDPEAGSLQDLGDVLLPGHPSNVLESNGYAVATTPSSVVIVAPACGP